MFSALLARLIFLIFGCTYPIYKSYKILSNPLCDYDVLQQLYGQVKFFVVFCAYVALECITDTFLFWVPFYYEVKIGFLAWVTSPISGGAVKIYDHFVEPMIRLKEPQIERFVVKCSAIGYGSCYQFSMRLASRILSTVLDAALRPAARVNTEMVIEIDKMIRNRLTNLPSNLLANYLPCAVTYHNFGSFRDTYSSRCTQYTSVLQTK